MSFRDIGHGAEGDVENVPENQIQMTTAQVRKLARLTRLHAPEAILKIEQWEDRETDFIRVEWLDEYGYRVRDRTGGRQAGHAVVIRENGWSNPSVARMTEELRQPTRRIR